MSRHPSRMRFAVSLVLFSMALLLAACSRGAPTAPTNEQKPTAASPVTTAAPSVQTHEILISGFKYQPDTLTVQVGDTVEWKNADIVPHTATAADKEFDSGSIAKGASWSFVAAKKGTYPYICTLHPNMKATLIVQ